MKTDHIFVYASLLSGFKSPAYEYISRYFEKVSDAEVTGTLYDMGGYLAGTPDDKGFTIKGELYKIRKPAELSYALAQLDGYEGLHPEAGETSDYRREMVGIVQQDGQIIEAWVYWYNHPVVDKPIFESGDVRDFL